MMNKFRTAAIAVLAGTALMTAACGTESGGHEDTSVPTTTAAAAADQSTTTEAGASRTVAELASSTADLSMLSGLIKQSGLDKTLDGSGTFTVLAPTNAAFAAVDPATLASLQTDPNGALRQMLSLHVLPAALGSKALAASVGECVDTLNGAKLKVEKQGEDITIGGAKVTEADTEASNGVVHTVDSVVLQPSADC